MLAAARAAQREVTISIAKGASRVSKQPQRDIDQVDVGRSERGIDCDRLFEGGEDFLVRNAARSEARVKVRVAEIVPQLGARIPLRSGFQQGELSRDTCVLRN